MTADRIFITVVGFALIGFIIWFFWFKKTKATRVTVTSSGHQEATILATGGYTPDAAGVQHGKPVRLNFRQEETAGFFNMVLLPDFDRSAQLPTGEIVAVDFVPQGPGKFELACQMGMLHGKLNVE